MKRVTQTPDISAEPSVWHVCPDGGGEGKQRSRVEQLELEVRRSCGGMRAKDATTRSSWLKIRAYKVLMREMLRLQWCGCMCKIRACVPPSSRVWCPPPPTPISLFPIQEQRLRCLFSFLQWENVSGHLIYSEKKPGTLIYWAVPEISATANNIRSDLYKSKVNTPF